MHEHKQVHSSISLNQISLTYNFINLLLPDHFAAGFLFLLTLYCSSLFAQIWDHYLLHSIPQIWLDGCLSVFRTTADLQSILITSILFTFNCSYPFGYKALAPLLVFAHFLCVSPMFSSEGREKSLVTTTFLKTESPHLSLILSLYS